MDRLFAYSSEVVIDGKYNPIIEKANNSHASAITQQHKAFVKEGNNSIKTLLPFVFLILSTVGMCFLFFRTSYSEFFHPSMLAIFPIFGIITVLIYSYFIKKPTVEKLDLQSRIQGFKQYISMAESDRMNILNPPEMTVGHFEALLPYAFAFGIEHDWTNVFEKILTDSGYTNEHSWMYYDTGFSRNFSRTVSGSSTQPQSSGSGGSSGGGFSGGGGGGGGVGGW